MLALACTLFFLHKEIEPYHATLYMCWIVSPEACSFFWGMLADSVPIYGRRGHIILAALLQIAGSIIMLLLDLDTSVYAFVFVAMIVVCGKAWLTPVIEALMVN